jgi:hypothetical protein
MLERKKESRYIHYVALNEDESHYLFSQYGLDIIVTIARSIADHCAETSGYLSLISYYDPPSRSSLIQLRMRRSPPFKGVDLRNIISALNIEDGGGHEGAVGFRVDRTEVPNYNDFIQRIISETETMIAE